MHGRDIPVRCSVTQLTSMSVHADADGLVSWVDELVERPDHVYIVHGEPRASAALSVRLQSELGVHVTVPAQFDEVELDGPDIESDVSRRTPHQQED